MELVITLVVFIISYIFLLWDQINRALVALSGAAILILFNIFSVDEALSTYVDWSTIVLLFSMMVLISITQKTGVFEFISIWMIQKVNGKPVPLFFVDRSDDSNRFRVVGQCHDRLATCTCHHQYDEAIKSTCCTLLDHGDYPLKCWWDSNHDW